MLVHSLFSAQLEVVPYVSVQKFSGLWYEIARTYNSYQDKCVASSVEYVLDENNEYEVHNRCFDTVIGVRMRALPSLQIMMTICQKLI